MGMRTAVTLLVTTALGAGGQAVLAEVEPENWIKYRQGSMKALGGHMAASAQLVRGRVEGEGLLAMHADSLARLSSDLPTMFPEGSDFGETDAREEIWQSWDQFEKTARDSAAAARAFAEAVKGGAAPEEAAERFKTLADSCKACHKDFRVEEE